MPIYDLTCDRHDPPIRLLDQYLESWRSPNPVCPDCAEPTERLWSTAWKTDHETFQTFETWADVGDGKGQQRVKIDSLACLRKIEAQTERAWRNGFPGAQPIVFRIFSQNEGNGGRFRNVFGEAPKVAGTFKTRGRDGRPYVSHKDITLEGDTLEDIEAQLKSYGIDAGDPLYSPDHLFRE